MRLPEAYVYTGSSADADPWARALVAETGNFARPAALTSPAPRQNRDYDTVDTAIDATIDATTRVNAGGGSGGDVNGGGGGGGGGDWLDGPDEFVLIIIAVIAVLAVVVIAAPLGLIALEIVLALGLAAAGIVLRLANIKPWTVLVLRDGTVVAAVAVKGWRSSRAVIAALRQHTA